MLYARTRNVRCFECGDIGHKRPGRPHTAPASEEAEPSHARVKKAGSPGSVQGAWLRVNLLLVLRGVPRNMQGNTMSLNLCEADSAELQASQLEDGVVEEGGGEGAQSGDVVEEQGVGAALIENSGVVTEDAGVSAGNEGSGERIREDSGSVMEDAGVVRGTVLGIGDVVMEDDENATEVTDVGKGRGAVEAGSSTGVADPLMNSLDEMNNFLDETFGKVGDVADFFPDTDPFLVSVSKLQKDNTFN